MSDVDGTNDPGGQGSPTGQEADGHPQVTPVPIPVARFDDPHMQPAARHPGRVEGIIALAFFLGLLAVAGFGAAYWVDSKPVYLGATLGGGLFLLGFGLTAWGKYLMPRGPFVEERHSLASDSREREALTSSLVDRTGVVVKRRKLLGGLFAMGTGVFGVVAMFPLLRSLGPLPGKTLDRTDWRKHSLLVYSDGRPVHVDDLSPGGIATVFPKGSEKSDEGRSVDQTVLIRVSLDDVTTQPGREHWGPRGYLAYSKMCTHLGCPVGLYEQQLQLLVCPCHQSMFNVLDGCIPTFGPAPRPLPQLPIYVDARGYLRARAGYDQPIGPGFWERSTSTTTVSAAGGRSGATADGVGGGSGAKGRQV